MIRSCTFRSESLNISFLGGAKFWASRHAQLAKYTVVHEESESAVRIAKFLHPEEEIERNQTMRVSISYRGISYRMSPPYFPWFSLGFPWKS